MIMYSYFSICLLHLLEVGILDVVALLTALSLLAALSSTIEALVGTRLSATLCTLVHLG